MTSRTQDSDRVARLREAIRKKRQAKATERTAAEIPARPSDEPARLGPMQRSLWLAHRLDPESAAYHLVDAYRVVGSLDIERLAAAFRRIARRHRLLRSTFHARGGDVVQEILPVEQVDEPLDEHLDEHCAVEIVDGGEDAAAVAVHEARRPFDLSTPPLIRLVVIEGLAVEGRADTLLMLVLHHILADEHALGVFWREISDAMAGRAADKPTVQYDDLVHWQREERRPEPEARSREIESWRERLDPPPDELALAFETPSGTPEAGGDVGRLVTRSLSAEVGDGVRELARASDATPFFVYAFAYRLLLQRLSDGGPPAFASPVSTRFHPASAEMIGYFTNPVVMPTDLDESLGVSSALRAFRQDAAARLAQASIPFQELVEELDAGPRAPGGRAGDPVFQTMFVLRRPHDPPKLGDERAWRRAGARHARSGRVEVRPDALRHRN